MRSSFTPTERHVVWFTINAYHDCHYCMAAHTFLAKGEQVPDDVIETARDVGSYEDPKLEALRVFTLSLVENRGWVSSESLDAFLAAGLEARQKMTSDLDIYRTASVLVKHYGEDAALEAAQRAGDKRFSESNSKHQRRALSVLDSA